MTLQWFCLNLIVNWEHCFFGKTYFMTGVWGWTEISAEHDRSEFGMGMEKKKTTPLISKAASWYLVPYIFDKKFPLQKPFVFPHVSLQSRILLKHSKTMKFSEVILWQCQQKQGFGHTTKMAAWKSFSVEIVSTQPRGLHLWKMRPLSRLWRVFLSLEIYNRLIHKDVQIFPAERWTKWGGWKYLN